MFFLSLVTDRAPVCVLGKQMGAVTEYGDRLDQARAHQDYHSKGQGGLIPPHVSTLSDPVRVVNLSSASVCLVGLLLAA